MNKCDICSTETDVRAGYILTTTEVTSSERYWRNQLPKFRTIVLGLDGLQSKQNFLVERIAEYASDSSDWLVCEPCSQLFNFDRQEARRCALQGERRISAGPAEIEAAVRVARPVIEQLCNSPAEPLTTPRQLKKYWQCIECGMIYAKDEDSRQVAEFFLESSGGGNISGGITCSKCRTRYEATKIYRGDYDMMEDDALMDQVIADSNNAEFDAFTKTWSYKGKMIRGPASVGLKQTSKKKRRWQFWKKTDDLTEPQYIPISLNENPKIDFSSMSKECAVCGKSLAKGLIQCPQCGSGKFRYV